MSFFGIRCRIPHRLDDTEVFRLVGRLNFDFSPVAFLFCTDRLDRLESVRFILTAFVYILVWNVGCHCVALEDRVSPFPNGNVPSWKSFLISFTTEVFRPVQFAVALCKAHSFVVNVVVIGWVVKSSARTLSASVKGFFGRLVFLNRFVSRNQGGRRVPVHSAPMDAS